MIGLGRPGASRKLRGSGMVGAWSLPRGRHAHDPLSPALLAALPLLIVLAAPPARAADAAHGKALAESCTLCHGPDGNAVNPMTPKLAGQNELYLIQALQDYRAELRPNNRPMTILAKKMSDTDIEDLAAWFASTKAVAVE